METLDVKVPLKDTFKFNRNQTLDATERMNDEEIRAKTLYAGGKLHDDEEKWA